MLSWFRPGHDLPFATPSRLPPDPTLFPHYLQNAQGLWLRWAEWWPRGDVAALKGVVFIVSGLGEHSGRYDSVALRFTDAGYACFSVDNQGAGGSEGVRLYVESFAHFVDDIQLFIHHVMIKYPELTQLPRFLLGHSMGGLIATHVAMRDPEYFNGVVLSGPAFGTQVFNPIVESVLSFFASVMPKFPVMRLSAEEVSANKAVTELVQQDPFYSNAMMRARFGRETLLAQKWVFDHVKVGDKTTFPLLLVHGEKDTLCLPERSQKFHDEATSTDKTIKFYADARHEVLTELCRDEVMADVLSFIVKRT